MKTMLMFSTR